ncbi:MAG: 50S ribosomal protein L6 [Candidatus Micrarchaeia archaeon]
MVETIIEIPSGLDVEIGNDSFTVSGPKGKVSYKYRDVSISKDSGKIKISGESKALVNTTQALMKSAFKGVTEGYTIKLQMVYAHFPFTIEQKGSEILIKNFLGEKSPRKANIVGDTKLKVEKEFIILTGPDKYAVGQTAANLKNATYIKEKDPRVFQDGIYDPL